MRRADKERFKAFRRLGLYDTYIILSNLSSIELLLIPEDMSFTPKSEAVKSIITEVMLKAYDTASGREKAFREGRLHEAV